MQQKLPIIKMIGVLFFFFFLTAIISVVNHDEIKELEKDQNYLRKQVQLKEEANNEGVYIVTKPDSISIFNETYQDIIEEKIKELENKKEYSFSSPLLIYNPYGTGSLSYYLFFTAEQEKLEVSYRIETDGYETFERTLQKESGTKKYEYQLMGFVPGETNWLTLTFKDQEGNLIATKRMTVKTKALTSIDTRMQIKEGESAEELTDGLYAVLGHDKAYNSNIYLFDNAGVLRNELILQGYRGDRILETEDAIYYSSSKNKFLKVNRLGKIEKIYSIGNYEMHHDYVYDEETNTIVILANKKGKDTIEDEVISLSLETGKITNTLDMIPLLQEFYQNAVKPKKNTYGGEELDWLHLNSLQVVGKDFILSSRELSTIIYVENAFENATIRYLITDPSVLEETSYKNLLLKKEGDFVDLAGQHSVTYFKEKDQEEGVYSLAFYNNNYQGARTRPLFDWENYPGTGTYEEGENSYYYEYEIDEKEKTYRLIKSFSVPYSSIVSNVLRKGENYIVSSGMSHCYGEYDQEGKLIREFSYTAKKYAYRVFKYDFRGFWFE